MDIKLATERLDEQPVQTMSTIINYRRFCFKLLFLVLIIIH